MYITSHKRTLHNFFKLFFAFFAIFSLFLPTFRVAHASVPPLGSVSWEPKNNLLVNSQNKILTDRVEIDFEAIQERYVANGVALPDFVNRDSFGSPYYFLAQNLVSGQYVSDMIAMCIDIFHTTYYVEIDSEYYDLTQFLAEEHIENIVYIVNAGLQLAQQQGLVVDKTGGIPLVFMEESAVDIMLATQIYIWQVYAKNVKSPGVALPDLQLTDFLPVRNLYDASGEKVGEDSNYNLSSRYAQLESLVDEYRVKPNFAGKTYDVNEPINLQDPTIAKFVNVVDQTASTAGFADYVEVEFVDNGIVVTKKQDLDKDITLVFSKEFQHDLGRKDYTYVGLRNADADQTKMLLNSVYTENYSINLTQSAVDLVEKVAVGSVELNKISATGVPLSDAEFTITDTSGKVAIDSEGRELIGVTGDVENFGVEDDLGYLFFPNVVAGSYNIQETSAPFGYKQSLDIYSFTVEADETFVVNDGQGIVNFVVDKGLVDLEEGLGGISLYKVDQLLQPLFGAEFAVFDMQDKVVATGVTAADGFLVFGNLVPATYVVREVVAPAGFEVSEAALAGFEVVVFPDQVMVVADESSPIVNTKIVVEGGLPITGFDIFLFIMFGFVLLFFGIFVSVMLRNEKLNK